VNIKKILPLVFIGIFFISACQKVPQRFQEDQPASKNPPAWAGESWAESGLYYFSGISGFQDNLSEAREQAYANALSKAAQYIGVSVAEMTSYNVNANASSLNSSTVLSSRDVQIKEGAIKSFEYTRDSKGFVGYVLLEYNKNALDKERQRHDLLQKKEMERVAARSAVSIFIKDNSDLSALGAAAKNVFSKMGYKISNGDTGVPLELSLLNADYQNASRGLIMCVIKVEVKLKDKLQVFEAVGYGKNNEIALDKAKQRAGDVFSKEVDKNIF
jgi:hypothetical protein